MIEHSGIAKAKLLTLSTGIGAVTVVVVGGFMAWQIWRHNRAISELEAQLVSSPHAQQQLDGLQQTQASLSGKVEQLETKLDKLQPHSGEGTNFFSRWFGKGQQDDKQA